MQYFGDRWKLAGAIAVSIIGLLSVGCGETAKDAPKGLAKVTGHVSFEGKAVATGTISFVPAGSAGQGASSPISSGSYSLAMSPTAPGAMPGDYKVIVIAMDGVVTMGADGTPTTPKSLIPEKYNSVETSGLTATVKAEPNNISFDLKP